MPEVKTATVLASEAAGPGFHTLLAEAHAPLGALPGQWGAFHTEVPNPAKPGEVLRRAWSFAELGEARFRLFVATVGPGSAAPGDARAAARWRAAAVNVEVGPRLTTTSDGATWWYAGDGARLDEVVGDAPPERVERFYTPRPATAGASA